MAVINAGLRRIHVLAGIDQDVIVRNSPSVPRRISG